MSGGIEVVARARVIVGAPFRLHGRCAVSGVDCVGLAVLALGRGGPDAYGLRMGDVARAEGWLRAAGLRAVDVAVPGDVLLVRPGPLQLHLMICAPGGFVHAHAGLRRVVEMPGASPWPIVGCWRI